MLYLQYSLILGYTKNPKHYTYSLALLIVAFLIAMIESAIDHDFTNTVTTGILLFLYYIIFRHRIKNGGE